MPHDGTNETHLDPEWSNLEKSIELDNKLRSAEEMHTPDPVEGGENPIQGKYDNRPESTTDKAVKGGPGDYSWGGYEDKKQGEIQKPKGVSQEDWDNRPKWSRPLEGALHAGALPALGVADFVSDAVGLVPWLKPIDQWWDENSPRHTAPAHKLARDASSIIIPTLYGGGALTTMGKTATAHMALPSYARTLGQVATYTGVDTGVAMISSHSKTDDNMAAALNDWLGWSIPWATRSSDSPDVRWKKNVFEAAGLGGSVELLGAAFSLARKTKLIPRDSAAEAIVSRKAAQSVDYDNPLTEAVERSRGQREAAQNDEMIRAIDADPDGLEYNAFRNDLGPDDAGRAVINTDADPLMAKVNHAQIQNDFDTLNGRAAPVVDEAFNREYIHAISGNERSAKLDQLFERISPNVDAVINGKRLSAEQINRSVDNLTNAIFGQDLPLKEFEFIVDDMKSTVFNSNAFLDEEQWVIASRAFKNAYDKLFDPNQMRASAMLTQQAADNITDAATAVKMLGDEVDHIRQMDIIFDKLNLLGQEVGINKFIVRKAKEYKKLKADGNMQALMDWMVTQGDQFDEYVNHVKQQGNKLNKELKYIAKKNPGYYKPFIEAYDATNGKVDDLHKLQRLAESNVGLFKKGFVDLEPTMPSALVQQIHAARINGMLLGMAPIRAAVGNGLLTALKPAAVFAGAWASGDQATLKRAMYTFAGIGENFKRGMKVASEEWRLAKLHPEEAMMRGRSDLVRSKLDQMEYMDAMAEGWKKAKEPGWRGKVALWNMTKALGWWNKQQFVKYGTNALYAIDGFTNSFMASGMARAKAYDEVMHAHKGAVNMEEFARPIQERLYKEAFDDTGKLTDEATKFASQEIALNLDNEVVKRFDNFLDAVPAARGIFLFPRTGVNAAELAMSFSPTSSLGLALPRFKRVMKAKTQAEKLAALAEHGIKEGQDMDLAFRTLKSEYIGRQIMGSAVVMGCGLWALEGNMTGNGPQDGAERARMLKMGWQPLSIKNPITGEWRSYQGFEPFASLMGLTADAVYQANRTDQAFTEDLFRKAVFAISMNVTNNTFVSGFEPLAGLLTQDPTGWNRFWAQQTDQVLPFKGIRSVLNNVISPQLRDVNNDFMGYLANGNKFLFPSTEDSYLPNLLDVYTGKPIRGYESITQAANAVLPFFKQNGDMEPWRQWMLSTGWDGLQKIRKNKLTGQPLTPQERHFINNWIAKNAGLKAQVTQLMTQNDGYFQKKMKDYARARGLKRQSEMPVKEFLVHKELDRIHDKAFENAWYALQAYNANYTAQGRALKMRNYELNRGRLEGSNEAQKEILRLQNMRK